MKSKTITLLILVSMSPHSKGELKKPSPPRLFVLIYKCFQILWHKLPNVIVVFYVDSVVMVKLLPDF